MRARLLALMSSAVIAAGVAHAQRLDEHAGASRPNGPGQTVPIDSTGPRRIRLGPLSMPRRDSSWWVPLVSTVVPGAGQALLGQDRFFAYLAMEGFAALNYFNQEAEAVRERNRYRDLAGSVARANFPDSRSIGAWAYYESMEKYIESGVFDRFPGGTFSPEVDPTTYNGFIWALARQTYWLDPDVQPDTNSAPFRKSINFYIERAVQPNYRWSWRNAQLEWDLYRRSIGNANQAYRDARTQLMLMMANHLLSTVDAFVTIRLRGGAGVTTGQRSISASVPWAPFGRSRNH